MLKSPKTGSRLLAVTLYPVVLFGACWLASIALQSGVGIVATSATLIVGVILLLTVLEGQLPYTTSWHPGTRSVLLDIVHSLVSALLAAPLVRISSIVAAAWLGGKLSQWLGFEIWPTSWPLALQLALGLIIADLGAYSAHRFMHSSMFGWRIHAVHHTPTRLYAIAAGRSHPFNALLTMTCESMPVILLGITPTAFALLAIFKAVNGLLQHSNLAMKPGILSYLIATSDVHRFHHSVDLTESNRNFGNTTMLWDHVFGTFYLPHRHPSAEVGIADADIPEGYLSHLLAPFRLARYQR